MIRGKTGFWLLTVIFSVIIATVVLNAENYNEPIVSEMDGTMGTMMKKNHADRSTIAQIMNSKWIPAASSPGSTTAQGHHDLPWFITSVNSIGFASILLIMPLILGASVLMIILWI